MSDPLGEWTFILADAPPGAVFCAQRCATRRTLGPSRQPRGWSARGSGTVAAKIFIPPGMDELGCALREQAGDTRIAVDDRLDEARAADDRL